MQFTIMTISLLLATSSGAATMPPEWKDCKIDLDCTVADGVGCVGPDAVNRRYLKDYQKWAGHENSVLDCAVDIGNRERKKKRTPTCKAGKCISTESKS